ncbi:SYTC protein, partial [Drymodes brunneopygia]|nr:SYTC protein [Drymodes brunneopygia]
VEAALVARVNGTLQDLDRPLECDTDLELLDFSTPEGREVSPGPGVLDPRSPLPSQPVSPVSPQAFWRSSACVLGAVAEQFFGATLCSTRATEDGFFCDVHMGSRSVQSAELPALEEACATFARARHRFERLEATRQQLAELLKHNSFQLERLEEVTSPMATVYRCGPLLQLCHGPLLQHTGLIGALRVLTSSAALWGGIGSQSLQRVAAVAFPSARDLEQWERAQEEAAQRDHRRIGKVSPARGQGVPHSHGDPLVMPSPLQEQELFFFHKFSPGSCFFLPRGAHVYNALVEFIRSEYLVRGFSEVVTPNLFSPRLWELSGHWQHYSPNIFSVPAAPETLSLKPMNCPAHCLMFSHRPRSWRELPLRLADFGVLHRNEPPGTLTGLTRVRRFQQDDAHIFCTLEQLESEIDSSLDFIRTVYTVLGFSFRLALATRPDGFLGDPETWDRAEQQLERSLQNFGQPWELSPGDGAFYGPKIDIRIRDALGRQHQCGTIQLDFQMPERFELEYARYWERGRIGIGGQDWDRRAGLGICGGQDWDRRTELGIFPAVGPPGTPCPPRAVGAAQSRVCCGWGVPVLRAPPDGRTPAVVGRREREHGTVSVRTRENRQLGELELPRGLQRLRELRDGRVPDAEQRF